MNECYVMDGFQLNITIEDVVKKLHLVDEDDIEMIQDKLEEALNIARPKAMYKICDVTEINSPSVCIEGVEFHSQVLASKLAGIHNVFAYVITCGVEVDTWARREEDYIVNLWMDMLKEMILEEARREFRKSLSDQYGVAQFGVMSPGAGNLDTWPIQQQPRLFSLLGDVKERIGVELTEGFLMYPTKSVSGVMFPSEKDFISCSICRRTNCPNRKVPFRAPAESTT